MVGFGRRAPGFGRSQDPGNQGDLNNIEGLNATL